MPIQPWSDSIWLITLDEEPALSEDLINAQDQSQRAEPMPNIVLDFSCVKQVNSSNLAQLLRLRKTAIDRGSRLKLAAIPNSIWVVFLTTGLTNIFDFAEDLPTALAAIQMEQ